MKTLGSRQYNEISTWIYRNARQVDLALWQYFFESGSRDAVLAALSHYQNSDGGFGNGLEPDCLNPESSPYTTLYAINILKQIGFDDIGHPIMQGIFKFLESGRYFTENGWLFSIPTNNDHAHAPWWTYSSEGNAVESTGVTAELCSFVLRFFDKDSDLYKKVVKIIDRIFEGLKTRSKHGDMGIGGYCILLDAADEAGLKEKYDYDGLSDIINRLVTDSIERDTSKWAFYGVRPSNYIKSPDSIYYKENEDIMQKELDYLIETRPVNNVWGITWSWFENNERYQKEFAISENWWKAIKATEIMVLLKNFDRL
ncbi:MAG TPA: hypothetical protein VHT96_00210 [Clostridia bacterium]|nr:hypothetical protein [Clostridia bacterium]